MKSIKRKKSDKELHYGEDLEFRIERESANCEGCIFASPDTYFDGKLFAKGSANGICEKYPNFKPNDILKGGPCKLKQTKG